MSLAYYNEIDPRAAQWLRNLIDAGAIAPGVVDERDLRDVTAAELSAYTQCHFFAGIGVWSYALRLAGWPDDRPVWTGSCPCQPFSSAGKGAGFADERHIWPYWHHLIRVNRPAVVFGEQVASRDGLGWLDLVQSDLEGENYAVRPIDTCSAGFGAPHIRQRLWFVANANKQRCGSKQRKSVGARSLRNRSTDNLADSDLQRQQEGFAASPHGTRRCRGIDVLADPDRRRSIRSSEQSGIADAGSQALHADRHPRCRSPRIVGHDQGERRPELRDAMEPERSRHADGAGDAAGPGPTNGHWRNADWLGCRDGRWRAVEPGTSPLVDGTPGRVGLLRGYGNAINAHNAAAVIRAADLL